MLSMLFFLTLTVVPNHLLLKYNVGLTTSLPMGVGMVSLSLAVSVLLASGIISPPKAVSRTS